MSSKYTIADAVRMMGHLLEHHPAEGTLARNKNGRVIGPTEKNAACWCYIGSGFVVAEQLHLNVSSVFNASDRVSGISDGNTWDSLSQVSRKDVAKKLQEYKG
jgi:hypothetical protein